jgi:hypothetical protein
MVDAQVGIIALSTAQYVERIAIAYRMGCRMFQISLPSWGTLSDREAFRCIADVCEAYPDCRFLHYNLFRARRLPRNCSDCIRNTWPRFSISSNPLCKHQIMDGAFDKTILSLGGFEIPLELHSPYDSFSQEAYEECRQILHRRYANWLDTEDLDFTESH